MASEPTPAPAAPQPAPDSPADPCPRARPLALRPELVGLGALLIATSFALMLVHIGNKPFWVDESIAVLPAKSILTKGLPESPFDLNYMAHQLEDRLWDPSAPLYRYSVAAMAAVFGFDEVTTRSWSVLFGALLLVPCFLLFRRLYGATSAWVAVVLMAGLPGFAEHCREARHFTFVAACMTATFYFVVLAASGESRRAQALWPTFSVATVLGHYVGYLSLPVLGLYLLASRRKPLLSRRYLWVYGTLFVVYGGIQAKYGNTLPFMHSIGCHNRNPGCEPNPFFYLATTLEFLGADRSFMEALSTLGRPRSIALVLAFVPVVSALIAGMVVTVRDYRRDPARRAEHQLVLAWFWVPLLLLTTQELKFPRYLFYVLPPMCLFVARGLVACAERLQAEAAQRVLLAVGLLVLALGPEAVQAQRGDDVRWSVQARFVRYAQKTIRDDATDTWERTRAQTEYLRGRVKRGDFVVTSFDDASLGYYLGQFVHGFLNSNHDDAFFMNLLAYAKRKGKRIHFIDMLPAHNYCHTPGMSPVNIDCRKKYARFYAACTQGSPTYDPACHRRWFQ
jgi:4-amino-4-deoxy-L-arabinose transferase-like glycosyltransferase